MTEHFSFFDAIQDSNGHYDREYNAQQFTDYFKSLVTTGVMKGAYNQLEVTANGSNMTSSVKSGVAFVEGRYYYNDALLELIHDTEVIGLSRIDRIVVRMDLSTDARYVKTFIKKGVPATSPVVPPLTQTTQVYEISLAQILVVGGQTFIATNAVTDERGKDIICPWAGSNILPSFDDNALATHMNNFVEHTPYAHAISTDGVTYNVDLEGVIDYVEGMAIAIKPSRVSSGSTVKLSINGLPAKDIVHAIVDRPITGLIRVNAIYTLRYNGSYFIIQGDGFGLMDSFDTDSTLYAPTVRALKQVNDKLEGQWVTVTPTSTFEDVASNYPTRIKKVGGIVVVEAYLKIIKTLTSTTILTLPVGYRPRHDFSFRIYRQRGSVYEHLNGIGDMSSIMTEGNEMSKYAIGDFIRFHIVFAANQL